MNVMPVRAVNGRLAHKVANGNNDVDVDDGDGNETHHDGKEATCDGDHIAGAMNAARRLGRMSHHIVSTQTETVTEAMVAGGDVVMPSSDSAVSGASNGVQGDRDGLTITMANDGDGSAGSLEVTQQEHRVLEHFFPYGDNTASWGTRMHPAVHRVVGKLVYAGWTVKEWLRYFSRFNTSQWAQHHDHDGGLGSPRWTAAE